MKLEFGIRQEPLDDAIARHRARRETFYGKFTGEAARAARLIDALAGEVRIPRRIEVTFFSRRREFTRTQRLQVGP